MVRHRITTVDFQKLERRPYYAQSAFGKMIIDQMIEDNKEKVHDLNDYQKVLLEAVIEGFKSLTVGQREVISLKFGLRGDNGLNFRQIAKKLGIARQSVEERYDRGLKKLRNMIKLNEKVVKSIKLEKN